MLKRLCLFVCSIVAISNISVSAAQQVNVSLNGKLIDFDSALPTVKDNRTLIPLRGLFEQMGYEISWEPNLKAATISKAGNSIVVRANKEYITVNNIQKEIDVQAQIIDGWMMIPLRAVADSTGADITWDPVTKIVSVTTDNKSEYSLNIDEYAKEYSSAIEPLEYLEDVSTQLNTLNSDSSRANAKKTLEMLEEALKIVEDVTNNVENLEAPDKFKEYQEVSVKSLKLMNKNISALIAGISGEAEYGETKTKIDNILMQSKEINATLSNINF